MSKIGYPLARLSLLPLAAAWILSSPVQARQDTKPVKIVIIVPEGATLYVDDTKTTATGTRRAFESPPVAVGRKYFYQVKAVWKGPDGKEVVREEHFSVKPGETNELDLTKKDTPKLGAKLDLDFPLTVDVDAGAKKAIVLKVKREHFKGPVKVTFTGVPVGGKISDLTIAADKNEGAVELELPKDAKSGAVDLIVRAEGGEARVEGKIKLSIKAAPPAPPMAKLTITAPAAPIDVEVGDKKVFEIKIKRENVKGPVKVTFTGSLASISIADTTIASDASVAMVEVNVAKVAKPGVAEMTASATAAEGKAETKFKIEVKPAAKVKEKDKDKPKDR